MKSLHSSPQRWIAASTVLAVLMTVDGAAAAPLPSLADVQALVTQYFAERADYRSGDLITHGDVKPLLEALARQGFDPQRIAIGYDPFLPDNALLVTLLRTPQRMALMREIARLPSAYERLDRLTCFAEGRDLVRALIQDQNLDGIAQLTTAAGAAMIEARYPDEACCANFDAPNGQIYTQQQLLDYLTTMHRLASGNFTRPTD